MVVIPEDQVIKELPNGDYEVTKNWMIENFKALATCKDNLEQCRKR
jgi:hypothetical protein